ncbi:chymotrypsin-like protease CTRL-1 isoform X1 [Palaemon carinicauda]|uniref:chymotrypsin-like protease CTRL-1 isoform X1 n=1 Tax=Palaemon carinicauda TaxID=392227 RepID=UPI0035B677B0
MKPTLWVVRQFGFFESTSQRCRTYDDHPVNLLVDTTTLPTVLSSSTMIISLFISTIFLAVEGRTVATDVLPGETCEMGAGVAGRCEEIWACLKDEGVVQRSDQVNVCSSQEGKLHVCCRRPRNVAKELCDAWRQYWRGPNGECEVEHPLIIGGTTANLGEFPHMALFGRKLRSRPIIYDCGGTLVSPHYVVTAAHCLLYHEDGVTYWIKLGEHDLEHDATNEQTAILKGPIPSSLYLSQQLKDTPPRDTAPVEQVIQVVQQVIYPDYDIAFSYHDIALLKLKTPAQFTYRVLPACLPYQFPVEDYVDQRLTVTGWGRTSGVQQMSPTLQKVKVPVVDRLKCSLANLIERRTPLGITEDLLCAGELGKDSCGGDSGGPLTTQVAVDGSVCEHTLVGVVSFGIGMGSIHCGELGVYGRVSSYLDWITGFIAPNITASV